jgi:hypothetical protein
MNPQLAFQSIRSISAIQHHFIKHPQLEATISVLQFDLESAVLHGEFAPQEDGPQQEPFKVLWFDPL